MAAPNGSDKLVFPQPLPEKGQSEQRQPGFRGLTLLDHLAIEALPVAQRRLESLEASYIDRPPVRRDGTAAQVAAEAYDLAEAMLSERAERLTKYSGAGAAPQA